MLTSARARIADALTKVARAIRPALANFRAYLVRRGLPRVSAAGCRAHAEDASRFRSSMARSRRSDLRRHRMFSDGASHP